MQALLRRSAQSAVGLGISEPEFIGAAGAAYRETADDVPLVSLVTPLTSALHTEIVGLIDAQGGEYRERALADARQETTRLAIAMDPTARELLAADTDVVAVGASLRLDVLIALSALAGDDELLVYAPDDQTLAAVELMLRWLKPELPIISRIGTPNPTDVGQRALLQPRDGAIPNLARAFTYRAGLSDVERRMLVRRLRQCEAGEPAAAAASADRTRSRIGTTASQMLG
jgi:hypothetical protein